MSAIKRILIADTQKSSLVITSEIFKDNFPGVQVVLAKNCEEVLEKIASQESLDAIILDYDLPGSNGAYTAAKVKEVSDIPVLITAFESDEVEKTIQAQLHGHEDCLNWIKKPLETEKVVSIARRYSLGVYRCQRRLLTSLAAQGRVLFPLLDIQFPLNVQNCSAGGCKIEVDIADLSTYKKNFSSIKPGEIIELYIPPLNSIEKNKFTNTLNSKLNHLMQMQGKVIWTEVDKVHISYGLEFLDQDLGRQLYRALFLRDQLVISCGDEPRRPTTLAAKSRNIPRAG